MRPMIKQGDGGAIVLISSVAGLAGLGAPIAGSLGYTVAKHGVVGLMRAYANFLAAFNIRVNSIHPAAVKTLMIDNEATRAWLDGLAQQNLGGPDLGNALPVQALEPGTSPTRRSTWCPTPDATSPGSRFRSTRGTSTSAGVGAMAPPLELTSVPVGGDSTAPARRSDRQALDGAGHRRARHRDRRGLGRPDRRAPPRCESTGTPGRRHRGRPPGAARRSRRRGRRVAAAARRSGARLLGCAPTPSKRGRPTTRSRWPAPRWPPARSLRALPNRHPRADRAHRHAALPRLRPRVVRLYHVSRRLGTHLGFASGANYRGTS